MSTNDFTGAYAVIFTSQRSPAEEKEYSQMAQSMEDLAKTQKGFLGIRSTRDTEGFGMTVSYWESLKDIAAWRANSEHQVAQHQGRSTWYQSFSIQICKIERSYEFLAPPGAKD